MSPSRRQFLRAMAAGAGATASAPLLHYWSGSRSTELLAGWFDPPGESEWISHRPMRPLPVASDRPIDESSRAWFLSPTGSDSSDGRSEGSAWATFARAAETVGPGDTLYLVAGRHRLASGAIFNRSGVPGSPITLRALPGELTILDCSYPEFFESPDTAWEPHPPSQGGVEGEFRSTRTYPLTPETRVIGGNFGDSMVPLFRYMTMLDLRSQNELHFPALSNNNYLDPTGIYCGPGAMWNPATGRIHIRLSHTHIPQLSRVDYLNHGPGFDHNYTGETDPRRIPLILCRNVEVGVRCSHVRVLDLVFQGQKRVEFGNGAAGHTGVEVDGVHVYAGPQPFGVVIGGSGKVSHSKFRGYDAPWSNRFSDKNRTDHGLLVQLTGAAHEIAHSEFTDHHDGVRLTEPNETVEFHHNLLENMNDDGLFLTARHPSRMVRIWQNVFRGAVSYLPFAGGGQGVVSPDEVGIYIYRNFFDLRRRTYGGPPLLDSPDRGGFRSGLLMNEHSNSIRPNLFFYHNDIVLEDGSNQDWYLARLGDDFMDSHFHVRNNILVQFAGRPRDAVRPIPTGTFDSRANLLWGVRDGPGKGRPGDVLRDPEFVRLPADWREGVDLHLRPASPAIDAGAEIPAEWPDPLRSLDAGPPDIGAIPFGVGGEVLGPDADR